MGNNPFVVFLLSPLISAIFSFLLCLLINKFDKQKEQGIRLEDIPVFIQTKTSIRITWHFGNSAESGTILLFFIPAFYYLYNRPEAINYLFWAAIMGLNFFIIVMAISYSKRLFWDSVSVGFR